MGASGGRSRSGSSVVGEVEQPVFEAPVERVGDREALARSPGQVEHEIDAHGGAEHDTAALRLVRRHRLAVERDHQRAMVPELEAEDRAHSPR